MNGTLKSQTLIEAQMIGFCSGLSQQLLTDMYLQAQLDYSRDVELIRRRVTSEGLGFLTKTLPKLGKAVQAALLGERLKITHFKLQRGSRLPHFMKDAFSRVFTDDGAVREHYDSILLKDIIQLCFTWYKLEVPYAPQVTERFLQDFKEVDANLPRSFLNGDPHHDCTVLVVQDKARWLLNRVLSAFDPYDIIPKHGPGAVATGEGPNEKMRFKRIYSDVEECYPFTEYFFLSDKHRFDMWDQYWDCTHIDSPCAKVVLVPKDSRGPRLISEEPLEIQYIQQGIGRALVDHLEKEPLTSGHVNFRDQGVNRNLALQGSVSGAWSTIDLSAASDRVSLLMVEKLFRGTPLYEPLFATRSHLTELPSGERVTLRKFAPMGSALCFPVEALCFWALTVACIHQCKGGDISDVASTVFVYGDDIIVQAGDELPVFRTFPEFGLKVNEDKSCHTGFFRESCGCDAYRGEDVTPIKVKRIPPTSPKDGSSYASWIAITNALYNAAYYNAAHYARKRVEKVFGKITQSHRKTSYGFDCETFLRTDGKITYCPEKGLLKYYPIPLKKREDDKEAIPTFTDRLAFDSHCRSRFNADFQRQEFYVSRVQPVSLFDTSLNSWSELHRHLNAACSTKPYLYTFPRRVKLKRGWWPLQTPLNGAA
jgi:hypothetical protein